MYRQERLRSQLYRDPTCNREEAFSFMCVDSVYTRLCSIWTSEPYNEEIVHTFETFTRITLLTHNEKLPSRMWSYGGPSLRPS